MTKEYKLANGVVKVQLQRNSTSNAMLGNIHYKYKVIITYNGNSFTTTYHDSYYNYLHNRPANIDHAVYCILTDTFSYDNNPTMEQFFRYYGYDYDTKDGYMAYYGCAKLYVKVNRLFTDDEQDELYSLVEDC